MRIYISGKISGEDYEDYMLKFYYAEERLREIYPQAEIINPTELSPYRVSKTWSDYMKDCIKALCDCDIIALLPDWYSSKGALLEFALARKLGIKIIRI